MIEPFRVDPGRHVVASLTAQRPAVCPAFGHAVLKLPTMWILVTSGTVLVFEMKWQDIIDTSGRAFFVATDARNYCVCAFECKTRLLMHGNGKSGPMKIRDGMARFATILVRSLRELPIVGVLVVIHALPKLDLKNRISPHWEMAL